MRRYLAKIRAQFQLAMADSVSPNRVGWSFAMGTFLAVLPTPGLSVVFGLGLAFAIKSIHTLSMALSFVIWNPLVTAPLYALSYKIGNWLFGEEPVVEVEVSILVHVYNFTRRFLIGNLLVASAVSLASYGLVRLFVASYQRQRNKRVMSSESSQHSP